MNRLNRLFSLLLALVLVGTMGCATPQVAPATANGGGSASPNALRYLALGDSYTIGEGAASADRWPTQLAGLLAAQGVAVAAPDYIARTGWTTAELQAAIADARPAATYGLVSLLIGVNNQYRGQSLAQYRVEFRALLQQAIGFAGGRPGHVVVLSIPDWGQSPYGQRQGRDPAAIGLEIDQFNAAAQDECRQASVAYINITDLTRAAAGARSQFTSDGLHYSGPQMREWADRALPVTQALLSSK
ncbi:GDSL-type esterase/lipase family protein [Hymenobacter sp. DH14]|uniref:GDSL-type esterase/lipase family protein n=1 Tax=Hymenobacter cyanobacteriorum TaxID=2926463 RepID=A0A9X1VCG9_9BACT|nr:GDSL-type esterase/lipase family protein [Hymenobacter cyanobacteriorum]MCI1186619.1 GDSL-type esterase/lipase family protein [Hymenobacter cyanobacteriorum]